MATAAKAGEVPHPAPRPLRRALFLGLSWLLEAVLLLAGFGLALLARLGWSWTFQASRLVWAAGAVRQYELSALIVMGMLIYENVHEQGLTSLAQTDRLLKALTGGLAGSILLTFMLHSSGTVSRALLVGWYVANLVLFSLLRPVMSFHLSGWLGQELILVAGDEGSARLVENLRRSGVRVALSPGAAAGAGEAIYMVTIAARNAAPAGLARWEEQYPTVALVPTGREINMLGAHAFNFYGMQLYLLEHPLARGLNRALKRTFDLVGAVLMLVVLAPVLAAVALAVRLDSRGPILFCHERLGQGGKTIRVCKFRTMVVDAASRLQQMLAADPRLREEFGDHFKLKRDPRVTRLGSFLRRTSLDELPQLWNVVVGEMSLVGPRPIVRAECPLYGEAYPIIAKLRPGVTGIWQTSGRNEVAYSMRMQYDLYYARTWSLWLDLAILLRTLPAVLLPTGY